MVVCNTTLHLEEMEVFGEMADFRTETEDIQIKLVHLVVSENEKVLK
jgi:hypothetical protein